MSQFDTLTTREFEIASALCAAKSNGEIADELGISIKTVDTHRGNIMRKLAAKNNVELLIMALQSGRFVVGDKKPCENPKSQDNGMALVTVPCGECTACQAIVLA